MRDFLRLVRRFRRDERGVFLAMFAIMSLALIATSGAVVDFVGVQNARSEAQFALDAAALALQPRIYDTDEDTLRDMAEDLVLERMTGSNVTVQVETANSVIEDGSLFLEARLDVPMAFVSLVGYPQMSARVASEATRKRLFLEVAFVLDNSGSMAWYDRMDNLQDAAECATNIIFFGVCEPEDDAEQAPNVEAAIIPFTSMVNIGADKEDEDWMDGGGIAAISNDNFDDDDDDSTPFTGTVDRFALYDEISNVSWEGCVEARHYPYSVNDAEPDESVPDTLFTPMFAPDMPDTSGEGYDNSYLDDTPNACRELIGTCSCTTTTTPGYWGWGCGWRGGYGYCSGTSTTTCNFTAAAGYGGSPSCSCSGGASTCNVYYNAPKSALSDREQQERLCKYNDSTANLYGRLGPNSDCPARDILPLTDNPATIISDITSMVAAGATNIHQGVIWGYHALSPTEPFTEGRGYDTAVSKVMIVMTDGENTYYGEDNMNGSEFLQAYGHLYNAPMSEDDPYELNGGRLGYSVESSWQMPTIMNTLTSETCENAKAEGIEIFTIGLEPPNEALENLLISCSSGAGYYYFPEDSSELTDVFIEIANQLAALRLAL